MKSKKTQYQPIQGEGHTLTDSQEVNYAREFKHADIAGGYRKPRVRQARREKSE
ncbi:MAG TPA: YfhE family protein [Bacillales bacterium]|nr:YfhE family protein [Bacillales bacterium]